MERWAGCCCQCEYLLLPSFTRGLILLKFIPPRCIAYCTLCERLEATDCILEAPECFRGMGGKVYTNGLMTEWFSVSSFSIHFSACIQHFLLDFMQQRLSTPNHNADAVSATPSTPLLREWAKAKLTNGTWKDALDLAISVSISILHSKKPP